MRVRFSTAQKKKQQKQHLAMYCGAVELLKTKTKMSTHSYGCEC